MRKLSNQRASTDSNKKRELAPRENLGGNQVQDHRQSDENRRVVFGNCGRGERWEVFREQAINHASSDEKKEVFAQAQPQQQTNAKKKPALNFGNSEGGLPPIQYPDGNQIEDVQPRG